ncbi:MAG: insulinase family protein [Bacteroidetes bacterium]|jgi:zinc protease|nr:insulinase family protein [Bacteroidota bacterium]
MASPTTAAPPTDLPDTFEFVDASGGIEEYTLTSNGLRVLVLEQAAAPVVAFMVTYHVGSRNEWTGLTGATHILEHLMFKGTERFHKKKGTSIFDMLQRVGARVNATTWFDRTNYYEMLPKEHLPLAIDIEADRMRGALLDAEDLESERTVILNEYDRGKNEALRNLYDAVWGAAFVAHPYHHPTIGWRSDIEHVTPEGLRHFYDTYYWPNNATVSIIGDLDRGEALSLVEEHFGALDASPEPIPEMHTREPEQKGERRVKVHQEGQLGAVMTSYKSPEGLSEDADALDILARVLASGKGSRLFKRLTDRGLTSDVFAMSSRLRDPGLFSLFAFLAPDATHEVVEEGMREAVEAVQQRGITDEELQRAQTQLKAKEAFGRDGPFAIAAQLNEAIAAGDWTLYTTYLDRIDRVTPDDVQRVAQTYLQPERATVGHYIPE